MDTTSPLTGLVEALVDVGGPLTSALSHMEASRDAGHSVPQDDDVPIMLTRLLDQLLVPLELTRTASELTTAAAVLRQAALELEANLFLVSPE